MIQIDVRRICLIMLVVSIPLLALAASRSAEAIYAVAVTTVAQMVALGLAGIGFTQGKRLGADVRP
jgi:hypothetical protein